MTKPFFISFFISILVASSLQAKTQFSSRYYDTSSDCACYEKNLIEGQDCTKFSCKEMAGYQIQVSFDGSACDLGKLKITKDSKELISLDEVPSKIEWRFSGNKPFAVIYRLKGPSTDCAGKPNPSTKETLFVSGLEKHSELRGRVDAKTSNANSKAREMADQGLLKK